MLHAVLLGVTVVSWAMIALLVTDCMYLSNLMETNTWKWSILLCVDWSSVSLTLKTLRVRCRHRGENVDTDGGGRGWAELREHRGNIHVSRCKIRAPVGICCMTRWAHTWALWQPGGGGMGGRWGVFKREGTCVYLWVIHADVRQKPTQYCKAVILQLK